jgi:hypothetical protein
LRPWDHHLARLAEDPLPAPGVHIDPHSRFRGRVVRAEREDPLGRAALDEPAAARAGRRHGTKDRATAREPMPAVGSVIAGATRREHVVANAQAARWAPTDADLAALRALG